MLLGTFYTGLEQRSLGAVVSGENAYTDFSQDVATATWVNWREERIKKKSTKI